VDIQNVSVARNDESNSLSVRVVYCVVGSKTDEASITEEVTILGK
jgi:hypothetical protein